MDVNEVLRQAREAMVDIYNSPGGEGGYRLAKLFGTLDEWLSKGGFLPTDWSAKRYPLTSPVREV